jgi:flagellar basal-body rod protein FlgG
MHPALWVSVTGLEAQNTDIRVISNNLANVGTTGYKKSRAMFEDLLYQTIRQPGAQSTQDTEIPSGLMLGTGVKSVATPKVFSQGSLIQTENELDMAVNGKGFFEVLRPDGTTGYTRDGSFQRDGSGNLVTSNGYQIQPRISIPSDAISITVGTDGTVSVLTQGGSAPTQVGQLQLSNFTNPTGLQPIGENQYLETVSSGSPTSGTPGENGFGSILQGSLETSNVNVVEELVRLIETQRAYEMNAKSVESVDGMLRYLSQTL